MRTAECALHTQPNQNAKNMPTYKNQSLTFHMENQQSGCVKFPDTQCLKSQLDFIDRNEVSLPLSNPYSSRTERQKRGVPGGGRLRIVKPREGRFMNSELPLVASWVDRPGSPTSRRTAKMRRGVEPGIINLHGHARLATTAQDRRGGSE